MKNRKKLIIVMTIIVLTCLIVGIIYINKNINKSLIKELGIEEGCYSTEKDKENLICFTKELNFYNVLYKYDNYYNDIYYNYPPVGDELYRQYDFKFDYSKDEFTMELINKEKYTLIQKCVSDSEISFTCIATLTSSDETETEEQKYQKVNKEFNEEIINDLPVFERNKEFQINFDGEIISCNLSWLYSRIPASVGKSTIKPCLDKHFDDDYVVGTLDNENKTWMIYTESDKTRMEKLFPSNNSMFKISEEMINYAKLNYTYVVSVNDEKFGVLEDFPIDPYDSQEKMTVDIISTKEDKNKEYGLYEIQFNKKYEDDFYGEGTVWENTEVSITFKDSKTGVVKLVDGDTDFENVRVVESKFTYVRNGNNILISETETDHMSCTITSDTSMKCYIYNDNYYTTPRYSNYVIR